MVDKRERAIAQLRRPALRPLPLASRIIGVKDRSVSRWVADGPRGLAILMRLWRDGVITVEQFKARLSRVRHGKPD